MWVTDAVQNWHGCGYLWCRPAAVAPIRPLAWDHAYAVGVALKRQKENKKRKKKESDCSSWGVCGGVGSILHAALWVKGLPLWHKSEPQLRFHQGPAQWVKGSSIAAAAVGHNCGSDSIPFHVLQVWP